MSTQYLLPCRCGHQFVVEPPQAGETLSCSCGAMLQVPTMLEMTALEPAPSMVPTASTADGWGVRQGVLFLGIVFLLAALGIGVAVHHWMRPIPPADLINPEHIREVAKRLRPVQTWETWEAMKQGIGRTDAVYAAALVVYHGLLVIPGVLTVLGIGAIVWFVASGRSRRRNA